MHMLNLGSTIEHFTGTMHVFKIKHMLKCFAGLRTNILKHVFNYEHMSNPTEAWD